jgi:hypothetical protein
MTALPVAENRYEVIDREMPISSGPSVTNAQYIRMRCTSGRGTVMRQIRLKTRSMVDIMATAVNIRATAPTADRRIDFEAN